MNLFYLSSYIRKAYYIIQSIVVIPMAILLFATKIFFHIQFFRLYDYRIGHLAANTELFLRRRKLGLIKNNLKYIGLASTMPCNTQLLNMLGNILTIVRLPVFINKNIFFQTLSNSKSLLGKYNLFFELPLESNEYYEFNNSQPCLKFTIEEEKKGELLLEEMSVSNWFICFHARDRTYLDEISRRDTSYHNFRDSDIVNYLEAAKYITKQGGYALRMGAVVERALPKINNANIIDYATRYRSEFLDIYLPAKCKFFLGNDSGISTISLIFNVPLALANLIPLNFLPMRKCDLFIPKKIWSIEKKRILTFKEIINSEINKFYDIKQYQEAKLRIIENTAKEIRDLAEEMNCRLDGTWKVTIEDEKLQRRFRKLFRKDNRCYGFPSHIGAVFLRDNQQLLK